MTTDTSTDAPAASGIVAEHVTHHFLPRNHSTPLRVLDDVSVASRPGHFLSIVGPSGCGKSTLLRVLAGLVRPTEGTVRLDGEPVKGADAHKGMVFQQDAVFPWLTVRGNVEYGMKVRGVARDARRRRAEEFIDMVGLSGFSDVYPHELSGGMRKRVDLARVYANDPDVLLMDEPFGALDAITRQQLQLELLENWQRSRKTVVFVTHDLEEAVLLSDTVAVMSARPGRIAAVADVHLERPRNIETRQASEFGELTRQLWRQIGE